MLPIAISIALKPWFRNETLDEADNLLKQKEKGPDLFFEK